MTPQARSLQLLRKSGAIACTVEQWLTFPERKNGKPTGRTIRIRRDAFNFADILCADPQTHCISLIQTTTTGNQAARLAKIYDSPEARVWLAAGGVIACHGWALRGKRGERKTWHCTVTPIRAADCHPIEEIAQSDSLFA